MNDRIAGHFVRMSDNIETYLVSKVEIKNCDVQLKGCEVNFPFMV